jgi:hypothetical protein
MEAGTGGQQGDGALAFAGAIDRQGAIHAQHQIIGSRRQAPLKQGDPLLRSAASHLRHAQEMRRLPAAGILGQQGAAGSGAACEILGAKQIFGAAEGITHLKSVS